MWLGCMVLVEVFHFRILPRFILSESYSLLQILHLEHDAPLLLAMK